MKVEQQHWTPATGWRSISNGVGSAAGLVLAFGGSAALGGRARFDELRRMYPDARLVSVTTAGEIEGTRVHDETVVITALRFEHTELRAVSRPVERAEDSYLTGRELAHELVDARLRHLLVFSEGLRINGTELARGLREAVPPTVAVTGGLAGDGDRMQRTAVGLDAPAATGQVVALGLYGERLTVGYGSLGGWDPFGPERLITSSRGNVLYELDGHSALELYKEYLGDDAAGLPSSGLLFPLALRMPDGHTQLVRTILGVDEASQSMTFAGDMPEGVYAQLMSANFDRLVDGAVGAARATRIGGSARPVELALLISCVGRKLILKQRVEEEVEGVAGVLGAQAALTGFYSYGEICPLRESTRCELHNQTMTVTTLAEG